MLETAARAERYLFDDPNTALVKMRQLSEVFARTVASKLGLDPDGDLSFSELEFALATRGSLDRQHKDVMRYVRLSGNSAAHSLDGNRRDALHALKMTRRLAIWFHRTVTGNRNFKPGPFVAPADPADASASLQAELDEARRLQVVQQAELDGERLQREELQSRVEELKASAAAAVENEQAALEIAAETEERANARIEEYETLLRNQKPATVEQQEKIVTAARQASESLDLDESETRILIDQQLQEAGWEADTQALRHAAGTRPVKGRNIAIAEWPTANGPADYVLFIGLMPVAVVEAKRQRVDVAGAITQAKRYSRDFTVEPDHFAPGGPWGEYKIPFLLSTNGRPYLRQIAQKSGVWFLDARVETNHPRALEAWYTAEGFRQLLRQDIPAADRTLEEEPSSYLDLRPYQHEAIRAVELQIATGAREMLVAMATGTGKTRTCIGLMYRLIKARRFRRVLFLVDRSSLGEQTADSLKDVRLENLQSFADIYDVKELGDLRPDTDTKLQLATVQGMVKRLLYPTDETDPLPIDAYDCIVIDECHRGYNLDQEMTDAELRFRDEKDYISKYRRVIEHFDAVKIGLTATPALHTTEIFGAPVYNYSYRQAVIDGFLSDHVPPYKLVTKLNEDGMKWDAGDDIQVYDTKTEQLQLFQTPDEVEVEVDKFNSQVITENFNRTVCGALAEHIDPGLPGKTLIFCVNDEHADLVVGVMKAALDEQYGPVHDDTVMKITGKADKPSQLIRRYKNEELPKIAVTVDLLTTGIDVPKITNIVFLRRVRSRILFDQMLGRGTRLCEDLYGPGEDKDGFRVFDAVGIYEALKPLSEMKPVVTRPNITFSQLAKELDEISDPVFLQEAKSQLLAKLRRRRLSDTQQEQLQTACGLDRKELIEHVKAADPETLGPWFAKHTAVADIVDTVYRKGRKLIISVHEDQLRRVERGYGTADKPDDYLESFRKFITKNKDAIPALVVITQRPRDLTRKQLRELKLALDNKGFTETNLRTAWRETTNQDVAATIIGYIRHVALDQPLISHSDRVSAAMDKIKASRSWTEPQRKWLDRIGKQLEKEVIVDRGAIDDGEFKAQGGGFDRLNKVFKGELDAILREIAESMWQTVA